MRRSLRGSTPSRRTLFIRHRFELDAVLERAGLQLRQRGLTTDQVDQARHLYRDGGYWPLARIRAELGVTANTVPRYLLIAGPVMRSPIGPRSLSGPPLGLNGRRRSWAYGIQVAPSATS